MNKILVSLGYSATVALPDDVESGAVIAALSRAVVVTSHGYGEEEKWTEATDNTFSVRKVDASRIVADDEGKARIEVEELKRSVESMRSLYNSTKKQLDELKAQQATA